MYIDWNHNSCDLGANAKFRNPSCLLSGRKVRDSEEREKKTKIMPGTMANFVSVCCPRAAHAPYLDQNDAIKSGHYVYVFSPRAMHTLRSDQFMSLKILFKACLEPVQ
jgi:hypothetical protein